MSHAGQIASRKKREQWASFVVEFRRRQAEAANPPERPQETYALWSATSNPRSKPEEVRSDAQA